MEKTTSKSSDAFQAPFLDDKNDNEFELDGQDESSAHKRPSKFNLQARRRIEEYLDNKRFGLNLLDDIFEERPTNSAITWKDQQQLDG